MQIREILCILFLGSLLPSTSPAQSVANVASPPSKTYANSAAGLQQQFADLLVIIRANDEPAIHHALDTLSIPNANSWIAARFPQASIAQEQDAYQQALKKFQSHVWWMLGNYGVHPDFSLQVETSQVAPELSDIGFESLIPRPRDPLQIQNFRMTSTVTDEKLGNPSFVSSFLYLDGSFRMVGGTYPFWAETLNATRGPMSVPPEVVNGHTIQAAAFRNDAPSPQIEAIVHVEIEVGHDGKVMNMRVLSGDPKYIQDSQQYLREAEFAKMPDDPRFANAKAVWDMEVVFFKDSGGSSNTPHP